MVIRDDDLYGERSHPDPESYDWKGLHRTRSGWRAMCSINHAHVVGYIELIFC
ncbi:hypothetical protein C7S17_5839 [Burkholderia thailandensis]|nr:hypothetical protein [Burkholderia thailandensis]